VSLSLGELGQVLNGVVLGDEALRIMGVGGLEDAGPGDLVRVDEPRYLAAAAAPPAAALLVGPELGPGARAALRRGGPEVEFARALELFSPARLPPAGVDPTARIGPAVTLGEGCSVGAGAVLGEGVTLGAGVVLHPYVVLGDGVQVGDETVLFPHVTVYE